MESRMKTNAQALMIVLLAAGLLAACGGDPGAQQLPIGWQVGGCAGEERALTTGDGLDPQCAPEALVPDDSDPCREMLLWRYDRTAQRLQLVDTPVSLNCCGLRSVQATFATGVLTVTERDEPDGPRCRCMCDATYAVCLDAAFEGPIEVRLLRHVTDSDEGIETVWEGQIDPAEGEGQIDLGPSLSWACTG